MIRILFSSFMLLHGIIHLMGFAKEWDLAPKGKLTGKTLIDLPDNTLKFIGILWLLTCVMLIGATVAYVLHREWYWIPAAAALLVSQTLIIIYWHDAKFGTIANVIILIAVILSAASIHFNNMVKREIKTITTQASADPWVVTEDMIKDLPANVQRWLRQSNVIDKVTPNVIHITQKGQMRSNPEGKWMPFDAEQYFSIDPPAFVWNARIQAAPFINIAARDKYENGHGHMLIKALYIYRVANSSGSEIDQGTLLRYLAEIAWFPQAAVSDYLTWEEIDAHRARVTMTYGNITASGIYTFDHAGKVAAFEAQRFGEFNGVYRKETWSIAVTNYNTFHDMPITSSSVTWKLKDGDFTWLKLDIVTVD